jgi:hypothetical protein
MQKSVACGPWVGLTEGAMSRPGVDLRRKYKDFDLEALADEMAFRPTSAAHYAGPSGAKGKYDATRPVVMQMPYTEYRMYLAESCMSCDASRCHIASRRESRLGPA